ncbi:WxL domain-containing protein [Weissella cibaria]|uniref:WxL domain-containing protein n=1 Tax=Weissella cibaria TaxID=137591 RepID=UPI00215AB4FE|nr:WxL domain-containing protein [Weissella cibaria]MCR8703944.1 WxL domain-containing protein [Weissella cibaria]
MMISSILKSTAVLGLAAVGLGAAVPTIAHADGGSYTTDAGVTFTPSTDPTNPVDPGNVDPSNPTNPVGPDGKEDGGKGTQGPLSIDYVSAFDFGQQKISSADQTYYAKAQSYKNGSPADTALFAQVTDNRGTGAGWTLTVQQAKQLNNGSSDLKGAQISMADLNAATQKDSEAGAALAGQNITLIPGEGAQTVMSATNGAGQGTWVTRMGDTDNLISETGTANDGSNRKVDKSVSLFVPGTSNKVAAAKYSTNLTWTLTDTPANSAN